MNLPGTESGLNFYRKLREIIVPKDKSDHTTFLKITCWLEKNIEQGILKPAHYDYILDCARDAAKPESRNPAAVFVSIIQKELGFLRKPESRRKPENTSNIVKRERKKSISKPVNLKVEVEKQVRRLYEREKQSEHEKSNSHCKT